MDLRRDLRDGRGLPPNSNSLSVNGSAIGGEATERIDLRRRRPKRLAIVDVQTVVPLSCHNLPFYPFV